MIHVNQTPARRRRLAEQMMARHILHTLNRHTSTRFFLSCDGQDLTIITVTHVKAREWQKACRINDEKICPINQVSENQAKTKIASRFLSNSDQWMTGLLTTTRLHDYSRTTTTTKWSKKIYQERTSEALGRKACRRNSIWIVCRSDGHFRSGFVSLGFIVPGYKFSVGFFSFYLSLSFKKDFRINKKTRETVYGEKKNGRHGNYVRVRERERENSQSDENRQ